MNSAQDPPLDVSHSGSGKAPVWERLVEAQRSLSKRFETLRNSRRGSVFFIEHGLSNEKMIQLLDAVSWALSDTPIQSKWWHMTPLPLIVAATEVGYRYRGTGTDFWPKFESRIGVTISPEGRRRVRDLFEKASTDYEGARPSVTPWTNAFRLIAWPITHALVPMEFHRQLSAALANLQASVQNVDDDTLHRLVRIAARSPSARFEALLENRSHAVPVIRALLGGGDGEISKQIVSRINDDLTADRDARIDIIIARRRQEQLRSPTDDGAAQALPEVLKGILKLRLRQNGRLQVLAILPSPPGPVASRLRDTLRRRRTRIRLWGVSNPVSSEWLLSGLPFPVTLQSIPDLGSPLLSDLGQLGISAEQRAVIGRLRLDFSLPMLFASYGDGKSARLVRGKQISASRVYWLLTKAGSANSVDGLPTIGSVDPFICYRLDPSMPQAAAELRRLKYRITQVIPVQTAGAPPFDSQTQLPEFLVGDERVFFSKGAPPLGAEVTCGSERIAWDGELVRVQVAEGKQVLRISNRRASMEDSFRGVQRSTSAPLPVCWLELSAEERTVQALLDGAIALKVDSLVALEGLDLSLELAADGWRSGVTVPLDPLPQVVATGDDPWRTLLDDSIRDRILQTSGPINLHARVGHLASESWTIERSTHSCWWIRELSTPVLESEMGVLETGRVPFSSPASRPIQAPSQDSGEAILLAPLKLDESVFDPGAMFVTFCTAPSRLPLQPPPTKQPRLRRARWGEAGSVGVQDLAEAWLRWSLAETSNLTAEIRRRQAAVQLDRWLAEVTCGEVWASAEREIRTPPADPWRILPDECSKRRLGFDNLVELSQADEKRALQLAIAEIRRALPDLWSRIAPPTSWTGTPRDSLLDYVDYVEIDAAFERAYGHLTKLYPQARYYRIAEQVDSADSETLPDQWDPVLESTLATSGLWTLGELLFPTDKAWRLMSLDLSLMPLGEIAEELHSWASECRSTLAGDVPPIETLRAMLALWISPRTAVSLAWQDALDTLVSERTLARAARYLALRLRTIRPLDPSQ